MYSTGLGFLGNEKVCLFLVFWKRVGHKTIKQQRNREIVFFVLYYLSENWKDSVFFGK